MEPHFLRNGGSLPRLPVAIITVLYLLCHTSVATGCSSVADLAGSQFSSVINFDGAEPCLWSLRCASGGLFELEIESTLPSSATLRLLGSANEQNFSLPSGSTTARRFGTASLQLQTTDAATVSVKARCSDDAYAAVGHLGCPTSHPVTIPFDGKALIGSDVDAEGPYQFQPRVTCTWVVRCADSAQSVAFQRIAGNTNKVSSLRMRSGSEPMGVYFNYAFDTTFSGDVPPPLAPSVTVSLYGGTGTHNGFMAHVRCVSTPGRGLCPQNETLTRFPGIISTDVNGGDGTARAYTNTNCLWRVECPTGYAVNVTSVSGTLAKVQSFRYRDPDSDYVAAYASNLAFPSHVPAAGGVMLGRRAVFQLVSGTSVNSGVTLRYTCTPTPDLESVVGCPNDRVMETKSGGVIASDLDGAGYFAALPKTACTWSASCPDDDDTLVITEYNAVMGSTSALTLFDLSTGRAASTVRARGSFALAAGSEMPIGSGLSVRFSSGTAVGENTGFRLRYTCKQVAASEFGCPKYNRTHGITAFPLSIGSDIDGAGPGRYSANSDCTWWITCPVNRSVRLRSFASDLGAGDSVFFRYDDTDESSSGYAQATTSSTWTLPIGRSVGVRLVSDKYAVHHPGFSMDTTCTKAVGNLGCPTMESVTRFPGVIGSDIDGRGPIPYTPNQNCRWMVRCPAGLMAVFTDVRISVGSGDHVRFVDPDERGSEGGIVGNGAIEVAGGAALGNGMGVRITSDKYAVTHPGFQLNYTCRAPQGATLRYGRGGCPERALLTGYPGQVLSDIDGHGPIPYVPSSACRWDVRCPAGYVAVFEHLHAALGSGETLRIMDPVSDVTAGSVTEGTHDVEPGTPLTSANGFGFYFTSDKYTVSGGGFTFNYTCRQVDPDSDVGDFGCPAAGDGGLGRNVSAYPGAIGSDLDGAGPIPYAASMDCRWTLRCPAGTTLLVRSLHVQLHAGESLNFYEAKLPLVQNARIVNSLTISEAFGIPLGSSATVRMLSDKYSVPNGGFTLNYTCSRDIGGSAQCPQTPEEVPVPRADVPIIVQSDIDGPGQTKSTVTYPCLWIVRCPSESFLALTHLRTTTGELDVLLPSVGPPFSVDDLRRAPASAFNITGTADIPNWQAPGDYAIRAPFGPAVMVRFKGDGQSTGFKLSFVCTPHAGFGGGLPVSNATGFTAGTVTSDMDTVGEHVLTPGRDTRTILRCPPRSSLVITNVTMNWRWTVHSEVVLWVKPEGSSRAIPLHEPKKTTVGREVVGTLLGRGADILYTPDGDPNNGYRLEFACTKLSASGAGEPTSSIVAGRVAMNVSSDADGAGVLGAAAGVYTELEAGIVARWNVVCPRAMLPRIDQLRWSPHSSSNGASATGVQGTLNVFNAPADVVAAMDAAAAAAVNADPSARSEIEWSDEPPGAAALRVANAGTDGELVTLDQTSPRWPPTTTGTIAGGGPSPPAAASPTRRALIVTFAVTPPPPPYGGVKSTTGLRGGFGLDVTCVCTVGADCPEPPEEPRTVTPSLVPQPKTATPSSVATMTLPATATPELEGIEDAPTEAVPFVPPPPPVTDAPPTATRQVQAAPSATKSLQPVPRTPTLDAPEPTSAPDPPPTQTLPLPTPPPPTRAAVKVLPPGGEATKATSQATTAAAAAAVNPAVAATAARAGVVLELALCEFDLGEPLEFLESPTGLALLSGPTRFHAGAAVMNPVIMAVVIGLHFGVTRLFVEHPDDVPPHVDDSYAARSARAMAKLRFPGASLMFMSMILLQPTVTSGVIALRHGGADILFLVGSTSLVATFVPGVLLAIYLRRNFGSSYERLEDDEAAEEAAGRSSGASPKSISSRLNIPSTKHLSKAVAQRRQKLEKALRRRQKQKEDAKKASSSSTTSWLWNFVDGSAGKWVDDTSAVSGFTKRFGLLFSMYDAGCEWFIAVEIGAMIVSGILDGLRSDVKFECRVLVYVLCALHVSYLASLVLLRPYSTKFDMSTFAILAFAQFIAAGAIAVYMHDIGPSSTALVVAEQATSATLMLATAKAVADLLVEGYKLWHRRKTGKKDAKVEKGSAMADALLGDDGGDRAAPLLGGVPTRVRNTRSLGDANNGDATPHRSAGSGRLSNTTRSRSRSGSDRADQAADRPARNPLERKAASPNATTPHQRDAGAVAAQNPLAQTSRKPVAAAPPPPPEDDAEL